jgi:hypothetical protein
MSLYERHMASGLHPWVSANNTAGYEEVIVTCRLVPVPRSLSHQATYVAAACQKHGVAAAMISDHHRMSHPRHPLPHHIKHPDPSPLCRRKNEEGHEGTLQG